MFYYIYSLLESNRIESSNSLFKHGKIHQEYKKILNKPNYPKQYVKLSTTNLTKTCFL